MIPCLPNFRSHTSVQLASTFATETLVCGPLHLLREVIRTAFSEDAPGPAPIHSFKTVVENGKIHLAYCPTNDMATDTLTKALPSPKVKHFAHALGLRLA